MNPRFVRLTFVIVTLLSFSLPEIINNQSLAKETRNNGKSPLEFTEPDPLLPDINPKKTLNYQEIEKIETAIATLQAQGESWQAEGNLAEAFATWYRELRLRQLLPDRVQEITALGRVGAIAWQENRTQDLKYINSRLQVIQQKFSAAETIEPEVLDALAAAYLAVKNFDRSTIIYEKILKKAREKQDKAKIKATLQTLGEIYLIRFNYPAAARIYEELLAQAIAASNTYQEGEYLAKLAMIYRESTQPANGIKIKKQLIQTYLDQQETAKIPAVKIALGDDYRALDEPEKANQAYQEAFNLAWSLQQLAVAKEALEKLADLYQSYNQAEYALQVYQELIKVEQNSYDYYGLMNTYEKMGEIYFNKKDYNQALSFYQKALQIAQSLNYRQAYLQGKIEQIKQNL